MAKKKIPTSMGDAIIKISESGEQKIDKLKRVIIEENEIIFPDNITEVISGVLENKEHARYFIQHAFGASAFLRKHTNLNGKEFSIDDVKNCIEGFEQQENKAAMLNVIELFLSKQIFMMRSLTNLSFEHPDMIKRSNIVVDARPVFDAEDSEYEDIEILRDVCDKALKNIDQTAKELVTQTGKSAFIPGKED
eukprot:CAMPEP_0195277782 /NCGR_PEP_ID=MMETSP0706-20130129/19402_1 /TAXON_ID=33640 /ORGANISM="Asterionellopsis glacialis, Strain CCMP134" /LENGTH=192 /DNA_ID=CAMNT_0040335813 /DNA_START=96 /DNA_END=674 /DNA_ORIENTATION=-